MRLFFSYILFSVSFIVFCQDETKDFNKDYTISEKQFEPHVFYIGDEVVLNLKIKVSTNKKITKSTLPVISWGIIKTYDLQTVSEGVYSLSIQFIPYDIGLLSIPPIDLGDIILDDIDVFVFYITDDDTKISNDFTPQYLPGTQLFVVVMMLGLVLGILIFIIAFQLNKRIFSILIKKLRRELSRKRIQAMVFRLSKKPPSKEIYNEIVVVIKEYLQFMLGKDYSSSTAQEIFEDLQAVRNSQVYMPIINLLEKSNSIRFSPAFIDDYEVMQDIRRLKSDIKAIYKNHKKYGYMYES